jgi:hypothetical protein
MSDREGVQRYRFRIPIGDWSGDGHGKCHWFDASAAKPVEAVREAYWAATEKLPSLAPTEYVRDYEDAELPEVVFDELRERGCPVGEREDFDFVRLADVVVWFLNQGDPALDCRREADASPPMLPFYGRDSKGRHIGHLGYGLTG